MKTISILTVVLFSSTAFGQNWTWQNPLPLGNTLRDVFAVNENLLYAAGDNGAFIKTSNGGENWQVLYSGVNVKLNACFFPSEETGYAAGNHGTIIKTSNGGLSFAQLNTGIFTDIHSLFFFNELNGFAAGADGTLLNTTDGGSSWQQKQTPDKSISGLFFVSPIKGWFVGEDGTISTTNDGGNTWTLQSSNTINILSSVFFIDQSTGWACGVNGTILKTTDGGNNWFNLNSGITNWLSSVLFFNENEGIAVGNPGIILTTSNGGMTWEANLSPSAFNLHSVKSSGNQTAFIVGSNGIIINTTDAGAAWQFKSGGWQTELNDVFFYNENEGIIVGNNGLIIKTTDGGQNWMRKESGTSQNINAITNYHGQPDELWAVGDSALLLFSSDRGLTWTPTQLTHLTHSKLTGIAIGDSYGKIVGSAVYLIRLFKSSGWFSPNSVSANLRDIHSTAFSHAVLVGEGGTLLRAMKSALQGYFIVPFSFSPIYDFYDVTFHTYASGWAVGKYGVVVHTTNRGTSWNIRTHIDVNALYSVHFLNFNTGFTAGTNGSIFKTTDGGYSWQKLSSGITNQLKRVIFIDESIGWVIGTNGALLKTINGGGGQTTDIPLEQPELPSEYYLSQNYPNPFNPSTKISFNLPESGNVSLKIYDIMGKEVAILVDGFKPGGKHEVYFDASSDAGGLASGVYFYKLISGGFIDTKKMLLIR